MHTKVFLSSTFTDLEQYRKTVQQAIRQLGAIDVSMEHFGSRDEQPKDACLKIIHEESDVFVGIYAHRYGYIPDEDEISITETEYIAASELNLPRFIYIVDSKYPWIPDYIDIGNNNEKLHSFKNRLLKRHVCQTFGSEDQLATKVVADLGRYIAMTNSTRVGPNIPVKNIGLDSLRIPTDEAPDSWITKRSSIKKKNRKIFLTHIIRPSIRPGQQFDVYIYLIRQGSENFSDVLFAEFYLGKYWNNKIFPAIEENGFIGISTSAYGTFLCICRITFKDGETIILDRYIDFETTRTGGANF